MKKQYGKPNVTFENFSLSSNIASSCGSALNHHSMDCNFYATFGNPSACVFFENGYSVFHDVAVCDLQPDGNSWSKVCYHVVVDEMRAFTS